MHLYILCVVIEINFGYMPAVRQKDALLSKIKNLWG